MKKIFVLGAVATLSAWHVYAQEEVRQAVMTGRPGTPKCTIEVEVDVVADVEVRGTTARLHTLQGSPATWRRFECNQPMPVNPANFHFRGIDGRGRQTLIGDPMNGGMAVIRIEDPKSGREGYTFDLEWQGTTGPVPGPGYPPQVGPQGPPPPVGDRDRDRDRDGDRDRRFGAEEATHRCGEAAENRLRTNGYQDTRVLEVKMDGDRDKGDWIYGKVVGRRGPQPETFGFACSVDFQSRTISPVNLRPSDDGYYGGDAGHNRFTRERAIRACVEAVQDRLREKGYTEFDVRRSEMPQQTGDNASVLGGMGARRGGYSDDFEFSCNIDIDDGRVRSVNVERHWR